MRIHHLAFRTDHLERLVQFYSDALGLRVIRTEMPRSVWLDADGALVMLEARGAGEPAVDARSMEMVAFAIAPDSRAIVMERLERAGVGVEAATAFTLYVRDPDGRRVGLSSYPHALA